MIRLLSVKKLWPISSFNLFIILFVGFSIILPLLFIQKGTSWNTIQFFYYFLTIFAFLVADGLAILIARFHKVGLTVTILILVLTIPTTWDTLHQYLPVRPPARISSSEIEALQFLREQPDGI